MLVIHSDGDFRCPISDGIAAFHALKALGTPARFVNFPDENHWVLKEENVSSGPCRVQGIFIEISD